MRATVGEGGGEGHHVDPVDDVEAEIGDEDAGQRRPGHTAHLHEDLPQRVGRGELAAFDHVGDGGAASGPVDARQSRRDRREYVDRPYRGPVERRVDGKAGDGDGHEHLHAQQEAAAVGAVGDGPARQRADDQGAELGQAHQPDLQGGTRQLVHLVGDGHHGELGAHEADHLAEEQAPVIGRVTQWRDVGEHPATAHRLPTLRTVRIFGDAAPRIRTV